MNIIVFVVSFSIILVAEPHKRMHQQGEKYKMVKYLALIFISPLYAFGFDYDPSNLIQLSKIEFERVDAYEHDWIKSGGFDIPPEETIHVKKKLAFSSIKQLKDLFHNNDVFTDKKSWSACFQPRHTLILQTEGEESTVVHICFSCGNFTVQKGPTQELRNADVLKRFFKSIEFSMKDS